MDAFERQRLFVKYDALVRNRSEVLDDITNGRVRYFWGAGSCDVSLLGRVLVAYDWYDCDAARVAVDVLDAVIQALWDCRRLDFACFD